MVQLDSLRAFAIFGVMLLHFWRGNILVEHFPFGAAGLYLFFVLSGFLITGLLEKGRDHQAGRFIGEFYLRRALRLLPLYYAVVLILLLFSPDARRHWPCYAVQIMNVCVTAEARWGPATHFWSLAAEEQFYLLWPFAVIFLNRRWLIAACWMLIAIGPVYRAGSTFVTHAQYANTLLPGVVDCLAAGALLALQRSAFPARVTLPLGLAGCAIITLLFSNSGDGDVVPNALTPTLLLPFLCWLVGGASEGFGGALGRILSNFALRYIGRISYCMYVIHFLLIRLPAVLHRFVIRLPGSANLLHHLLRVPPGAHLFVRFVALSSLTIVIAAFSWQFYEGPINRMRHRVSLARWLGGAGDSDALGVPEPLGTAPAQPE